MELSNFSSLIEVGATLNIACVAVEYVKSYTSVLCNQVFNLAASIASAVKRCQQKLDEVMDKTTLANLPDELSGNRSIVPLKRSLTKRRDSIDKEINDSGKSLEKDIATVCEVKSVSSICLWLFFYGIAALFLIGIESCSAEKNVPVHVFWTTMTLLGWIISIIGWVSDGETRPWWRFGYCSLRFAILSFSVAALIGISIFCFFLEYVKDITESLWDVILVVSMVLLYSNFIISSIAVWRKAKQGKTKIDNTYMELLVKCEEWNREAADLQGALHVDERLAEGSDALSQE